jgi:hypothetical protein
MICMLNFPELIDDYIYFIGKYEYNSIEYINNYIYLIEKSDNDNKIPYKYGEYSNLIIDDLSKIKEMLRFLKIKKSNVLLVIHQYNLHLEHNLQPFQKHN